MHCLFQTMDFVIPGKRWEKVEKRKKERGEKGKEKKGKEKKGKEDKTYEAEGNANYSHFLKLENSFGQS